MAEDRSGLDPLLPLTTDLSGRFGRYLIAAVPATARQGFRKADTVLRCCAEAVELIATIDRRHMREETCPVGFRAASWREQPQTEHDWTPIRPSDPANSQNLVGIGASSVSNFFTQNVIRTILGK